MSRSRVSYVTVKTDILGGGMQSYRGKRMVLSKGRGKKAEVTDIVEVTKGGVTYSLAPKGAWGSVYTANDHEGWYVVGEPRQSRRSAAGAARKGQGMAAWEKAATDKAVYEVLESWGKRGVTPTILTEDLFYNWGIGRNANFLTIPAGEKGVELSPQAKKLTYWKPAQQSAVKASLDRLVKAKKAAKFEGQGSRGSRSVATNYIAAKFW